MVTRRVMADSAVRTQLVDAGFEPSDEAGPEETARFVREELARWTPLLEASGLSAR